MLNPNYTFANYADDTTIVSASTKDLFISNLIRTTNVAFKWFRDNDMQANLQSVFYSFMVMYLELKNLSDAKKLLRVTLESRLDYILLPNMFQLYIEKLNGS